jgi:3-hydroxy-3-methylglutaryl CoA synthase
MAGITSYGAYIPLYRLSREILAQVWGGKGKGEKAVANADEDSLTMGVEAARDCIKGVDRSTIDALYFCTTTPPYKEKQSASIIATACDLREDIIAVDLCDSVRSATIAMIMALDAVKAGSARQVLVIAADNRMGPPDTAFESLFGDGAASFLIGNEGVAVEIEGSHCITSAFMDYWRLEYDKLIKGWENRFIREEGYLPYTAQAVNALLEKQKLTIKDFTKAVVYAPDAGMHRAAVKELKLDPTVQVQDLMFDNVGHTGVALVPMALVAALQDAKPGDKILTVNYGDGADAIALKVTDGIKKLKDRRGIKGYLASKIPLESYGKYMKFRDLMEWEYDIFMQRRMSLAEVWRHKEFYLRFHGAKCPSCGHIMLPVPKYCIYCQADSKHFERVPMADKRGKLVTYSMDVRSRTTDPPNVLGAVNFDGGGRFFSQITDRDPDKMEVGMIMEVTFRKIHDALDIHNYFWKRRPERGD